MKGYRYEAVSTGATMDLSPRRIFFILVPLALSLLIIAQAMKWQVDTIWKPCPVEPPPVDLLEIRKKVDEIIWPHIEESVSHVMFVSAPRCIRPESDSELPGYSMVYLLGEFYVSGSILVLARNQSLPVLFTPSLTEREHVFSGTLNEEEISRKLHVNVTSIENLATFLASQTVHTPSNLELVHENLHDYQRQLRQNNVTIIQNDLLAQLIVYSRFYKTDSELFALEYASQVAARAHEKIKSEIANSKATESILASQFSLYCAECSARLQAYNPIVGVGKHAAVLHFPTGESWDGGMTSIPKHAFVLIDAAPQWRGYASDLTRTYAASVTPEMKRIHHIVARAQKTGIQSYYVGGTWKGLVDKTVDSLLIGLVDIGLIHGEWTELREREVIKVFMPHGVGHPVGLDVHDPIPKRFYNGSSYDYVLANGMVHTVEPGIYFIPYLLDRLREDPNDPKHELIDWELLDTYLHVGGVRIEDVIAIDNQGKSQIFTKAKRFIW